MTEFSVTTTQRLVHAACEACPPLKSKYFVITSATLMSLGVALVCSGVALHFFTDYYSLSFSFYGIGGMFIVAPPTYCLFRLIGSCKKGSPLEVDSSEESGSDTESSVSSDYSYYSDSAAEDASSDFSGTESASDSETATASDSEEETATDSETRTAVTDAEDSLSGSEDSESYRSSESRSRSPSPPPAKKSDSEAASDKEKEGDVQIPSTNAIVLEAFKLYPPQLTNYYSSVNFVEIFQQLNESQNWHPLPPLGKHYGAFQDGYQFIHLGFYVSVPPYNIKLQKPSYVLLVKSSDNGDWGIYCSGFVHFTSIFEAKDWLNSMAAGLPTQHTNSERTVICSFV